MPFDDVRLLLQVRLVGHALVPDAGRAGLVGVDAGDDDDPVLDLILHLREPADIVADRVLVMGRAGADDQQKFVVLPGKDRLDLLVAFFLDDRQVHRKRHCLEDGLWLRDLLNVYEAHRLPLLITVSLPRRHQDTKNTARFNKTLSSFSHRDHGALKSVALDLACPMT